MTFAADIKTDAANLFKNSEFEEPLSYIPQGDQAKTVKAIINRSPVQILEHGGRQFAQSVIEVWIPNDATEGITAVKEGFDKINLKVKLSDECERDVIVSKILDSEGSVWHLEVRV